MAEAISYENCCQVKTLFGKDNVAVAKIDSSFALEVLNGDRRFDPNSLQYGENGRLIEAKTYLLERNNVSVEIDTHGASIVRLAVGDKDMINKGNLSYATPFEEDVARGGMPVNVPNLGQSENGDVPKHGWLERSLVTIESELCTKNRLVFSLRGDEVFEGLGANKDVVTFVIYELTEYGELVVSVEYFNFGKSQEQVSMGFHPYFLLDQSWIMDDMLVGVSATGVDNRELTRDKLDDTIIHKLNEDVVHEGNESVGLLVWLGDDQDTEGCLIQLLPLEGFSDNSEAWLWTDSLLLQPEIFNDEDLAKWYICRELGAGGGVVVGSGGSARMSLLMSVKRNG